MHTHGINECTNMLDFLQFFENFLNVHGHIFMILYIDQAFEILQLDLDSFFDVLAAFCKVGDLIGLPKGLHEAHTRGLRSCPNCDDKEFKYVLIKLREACFKVTHGCINRNVSIGEELGIDLDIDVASVENVCDTLKAGKQGIKLFLIGYRGLS